MGLIKGRSWFSKADRGIRLVAKYFSWIAVACILVMAFLSTIDIISSKFFGKAIGVQNELVQYLMIPTFVCFLANVQLETGIMSVDIFSKRYGPRLSKVMYLLSNVLGTAFFSLVGARSVVLLKQYIEKKTASSMSAYSFPLWPFGLILAIGMFFFAFSFLWCAVHVFFAEQKSGQEEPPEDEDHNGADAQ